MTRHVSARGERELKATELFRGRAYKPTPNDRWTVGFGYTFIDGRPVVDGDTMTLDEANRRFPEILREYEECVDNATKAAKGGTTQNQFDAMVSLCFNIGVPAFLKSTVLRNHNAGRFTEAAAAFSLFNLQKGKVLAVLVRRRKDESNRYLEPDEGLSPEQRTMPQTVDPEPKFTASNINKGGIIGGAAATVAAVQPVLDLANSVKSSTDSLGTWAVPVLLAVVVACLGYMIYERVQLRKRGQA